MYDEETIIESLVVGRGLTNNTFTKGKTHPYKLPKITKKESATLDSVNTALKKFLERKTKNAKKIGLLLSGGKDSRVLAALAKELGLQIECLTYRGNENEIKAAQNVAKALNYPCKVIDVPIEYFFNDENANKAVKLANGNPDYFGFVYFFGFKEQLNYDVIFSGELMTEYMDTGEYRWYEGKPKEGLFNKELIMPLVKEPYYSETVQKLHDMYESQDLDLSIIERKRDRIIYLNILNKLINLIAPATDEQVLSEVFSLPLKERSGSRLTREILKKTSPTLFKLPTGRSPLSLRFPLWIHQGYQRVFKQGTQLDYWRKGLQNLDNNQYENFEFDFLDKVQIKDYINGSKGEKAQFFALMRLENLRRWIELNKNEIKALKSKEIEVEAV